LREAAQRGGYYLLKPGGGQVEYLFQRRVPVGPLDNGAHLQLLDEIGRPSGTVTVLIEVKNIREWIYPETRELYELLDKSAQLQERYPDISFVPLLVCRRVHLTTGRMAKDLGFFVVATWMQFVQPHADIDVAHFEEVRHGLGLTDLRLTEEAYEPLTRRLVITLPTVATRTAERFARSAPLLATHFAQLRRRKDREVFGQLRAIARTRPGYEGGW
jgi:hypothetical protein